MDIPDHLPHKSNTVFHRLNKLATTKLKNYVGGKQLIDLKSDLKSDQASYQRKKGMLITEELKPNLISILEKKAKNAINKVKLKHEEEGETLKEEDHEYNENEKEASNSTKKKKDNKTEIVLPNRREEEGTNIEIEIEENEQKNEIVVPNSKSAIKNKSNIFIFSPKSMRVNINKGIASEMEIKRREAIVKAQRSLQVQTGDEKEVKKEKYVTSSLIYL